MTDIFNKIKSFTIAKEAMAMGIYPYFRALSNSEGVTAQFEGREVIMLGSNNYLGLTTNPRVRQAAADALQHYGTSVTGSRFLNGTLELHLELEQQLARYVGKEAALVFSTGYQTNLGTISALVDRGDYVILDKDAHASLVDGAMLSRGELKRFKHNDVEDLERVLSKLPANAGKMVIVDGVYSMMGDIAPLSEIVALCKRYNARILVDDAHGIGVMGNGHGTSAHFGVTDDVDLIMGTFSKSFAAIGGFIAGSADVIHYIQHQARSLIFSAALPASNTATVLEALNIMETEPQHVAALWDNAEYMRTQFKTLGFNIGNSQTPIIPIIIGEEFKTVFTWHALIEQGVYTNPVIPPAAPPNMSLLRTSYTATHTRQHLEQAIEGFRTVANQMDLRSRSTAENQIPLP